MFGVEDQSAGATLLEGYRLNYKFIFPGNIVVNFVVLVLLVDNFALVVEIAHFHNCFDHNINLPVSWSDSQEATMAY